MVIEQQHVELAYRKLKRLVYYDKTDHHLRRRLAEFECSPDFKKRLATIKRVLNTKFPLKNSVFKKWLDEIDFRIVPKSLDGVDSSGSNQSDADGKYISNVTSSKCLEVERVNYFFDGPVELHLISVLWIMFEGRYVDSELGKECYGARVSNRLSDEDDESAELFQKYHELYSGWRDTGIKKAKQLLVEDKTSVCILGLDVQEYYYRIKIDFSALSKAVSKANTEDGYFEDSPSSLLNCLEAICIAYREKIEPYIQHTHDDPPTIDTGIPIGLCSSPLLANWYLKSFDRAIKSKIKPAYYGRYIDDILLVVKASEDPSRDDNPVADFITDLMVRNKLLLKQKGDRYEINNPRGLHLQQSKCILQYFDVKHSIAGLEKFQKKLEKNSSDFLLLPVDESDSTLEDVAYELMYDGSVNKFRSVKGLAENRYELAKNLARQTILHLLTDDPPNREVSIGLRKFFKGRNAILFHDLWERVFTYFIISGDEKSADKFERSLRAEIKLLKYKSKGEISKFLKLNLESYLELSRALASALVVVDDPIFADINTIDSLLFKRANVIRHHFVRFPLLNYTNFDGDFTMREIPKKIKVDNKKIHWTPRFIHFDECLLLAESKHVSFSSVNSFEWASKLFASANGQDLEGVNWTNCESDNE